ncbi:MAG: (4Fe-4S)-binding protein [Clostridia bacterium]
MDKLTTFDIARVKAMGFLINRGTENFSGRIVPHGAVFTADDLAIVAEIARTYGNGKIAFTSRLTAEVVGISYDHIDDAVAMAAAHGLFFGGTGSKLRPITACKGTTCVYGQYDTQALAKKIHEKYYMGWGDVTLPHKFKIAVGGCPNSCMKPSLNDFGIEGHLSPRYHDEQCRGCKVCQVEQHCPSKAAHLINGKLCIDATSCRTCGICSNLCPFGAVTSNGPVQYRIFVGGTWGKMTRMGTPLSRLVTEDEIIPILEKTILWYRENAFVKERFGAAIDRIGVEILERTLFSDDLLQRKTEILTAELKQG